MVGDVRFVNEIGMYCGISLDARTPVVALYCARDHTSTVSRGACAEWWGRDTHLAIWVASHPGRAQKPTQIRASDTVALTCACFQLWVSLLKFGTSSFPTSGPKSIRTYSFEPQWLTPWPKQHGGTLLQRSRSQRRARKRGVALAPGPTPPRASARRLPRVQALVLLRASF